MKPEALDALTTATMRPKALDAATAHSPDQNAPPSTLQIACENETEKMDRTSVESVHPKPSACIVETTEGSEKTAKLVEDVVHSVKTAVDGALAWAEQKADQLTAEADGTGPYSTLATSVPSDMDAIASGVLPAMPSKPMERGNGPDKPENCEKG